MEDFKQLLNEAISQPGTIHKAYSLFHNYSMGNAMLAAMQCAARGIDLGPISTYKGWQSMGRQVKKGSKAITLLMPVTIKSEREKDGEARETAFTKFIARPNWFVLSQTEGQAVEMPPAPAFSFAQALSTLGIEQVGFTMPNGNAQGYAMAGRKLAVSPVAALPHKTTFHEMAHILLGHCEEGLLADDDRTPKSLREVEAESVAYICIASLGLEGLEYSRGYIQSWLAGAEIPEKSAQKIFATASQILKAGAVQA